MLSVHMQMVFQYTFWTVTMDLLAFLSWIETRWKLRNGLFPPHMHEYPCISIPKELLCSKWAFRPVSVRLPVGVGWRVYLLCDRPCVCMACALCRRHPAATRRNAFIVMKSLVLLQVFGIFWSLELPLSLTRKEKLQDWRLSPSFSLYITSVPVLFSFMTRLRNQFY